MKSLIFFLSILACSGLQAQKLSAGVSFGFHIRNNQGVNVVSDSITIQADGSWSMLNVYGLYMEYRLSKHWQMRNTISLTDHLVGFLVNNHKATCQFCNLQKATVVGAVNLSVANQLALQLPVRFPVRFHLIGGIRTNLNLMNHHPTIEFRNGTRHQGLAEVINHLDETVKPVYFNSVIGLKANWRNLNLVVELDKNLGQSITNEIVVYGESYLFHNRTNTFTMTAGYNLVPLISMVASSKR